MSETSKTLAGPGNSQPPVAEAERQLAQLCRSAAASRSEIACAVQLMAAAVMTSAGIGLRLAAYPGIAARLVAAGCALVVAARIVLPVGAARAGRQTDEPPAWVAAAAVYRGSLPGRVPAATLTAVDRYLPVLGQGYRSVHLYVGPCAGAGRHTPVCASVGTWAPPGGRHRLLVVGEHVAMEPALVAACLAHEARHARGWTYRVFAQLHHLRQAGWGWAVAGLAGAWWGWPGVLAAAAVFQASSVMLVWAVEVMCDRAAVRTAGRAGYRQALGRLAVMSGEYRRQWPGWLRAVRLFLCWLAGPSHPPLALRRALIRGPRPARENSQPAVRQHK